MGFQIGGLEGEVRIRRGVRFVKAVFTERQQVLEYGIGEFFVDPFGRRPFNKFLFLRRHLVFFLLSHNAAHNVRLTERETGHRLDDLHDLFLIDGDSVGLF